MGSIDFSTVIILYINKLRLSMLNMQFINICLFLQLFAFTIVQFAINENLQL